MRCLTIAEAVKNVGGEAGATDETKAGVGDVLFLCADEDSAALVEQYGFEVKVLNTDYCLMESELEPDRGCPWDMWTTGAENTILVDSYHVTEKYLRELGRYGRVFLMDDLQKTAYPVWGLVNYNVFADEKKYKQLYCSNPSVQMILGSAYVPLRSQFLGVLYKVKDAVRDVLITTGGGDADNIAGQILDEIYDPEIRFHVLSGRFNPHFDDLQAKAGNTDNISIHHDVSDMAGLMSMCDLAVSAGGSTVYELCAVGVPLICFSYAENQEALAEYVGAGKIAANAGAWHRDSSVCRENIRSKFRELCANYELRRSFSENQKNLIDGRGAERLAWILAGRD